MRFLSEKQRRLVMALFHKKKGTITKRITHITGEITPSKDYASMAWINNMPMHVKQKYLKVMSKIITGGRPPHDLLMEKIKETASYFRREGFGSFEGKINPNLIMSVKGNKQKVLADTYAKAFGYLFRQDAVPWYRPTTVAGLHNSVGIQVTMPKGMKSSASMQKDFYKTLQKHAPGAEFTYIDGNFHVINFRDENGKPFSGVSDHDFGKNIDAAADVFAKKHGISTSTDRMRVASNYISNNWKEHPDGRQYTEGLLETNGQNLLDWVDSRRLEGERLEKRFKEKFYKAKKEKGE